jgi:hypothetical protein
MTYEKSPTIWWIKSHNSGMKNWNFTKKHTDRKTINSNNSVKFEVNWPRARHVKWTDGRMDSRTLVYHNTSRLTDGRIKNHYLTLRSKVKVSRRSLRYVTHRLMVMHPHTIYNWPISKDKKVMVRTSFAEKKQKKWKRKKKSD